MKIFDNLAACKLYLCVNRVYCDYIIIERNFVVKTYYNSIKYEPIIS